MVGTLHIVFFFFFKTRKNLPLISVLRSSVIETSGKFFFFFFAGPSKLNDLFEEAKQGILSTEQLLNSKDDLKKNTTARSFTRFFKLNEISLHQKKGDIFVRKETNSVSLYFFKGSLVGAILNRKPDEKDIKTLLALLAMEPSAGMEERLPGCPESEDKNYS